MRRPAARAFLAAACVALAGCSTVRGPEITPAVELSVPVYRQAPNRCGPAALRAVYAYWGREETEASVAARIYRADARGTLFPMLVADAREVGFEASFVDADPALWRGVIESGVPVLCLLPGRSHVVVLTGCGDANGTPVFRMLDGSGRVKWIDAERLAGALAATVRPPVSAAASAANP